MKKERKDRPVSLGAMTARRFFRNRLALTGLVILALQFLFAFLGGALSPYGQDQVFYREELREKEFAAVTENTDYHFTSLPGYAVDTVDQAQVLLALTQGRQTAAVGTTQYRLEQVGEALCRIYRDGALVALAHKATVWDVAAEDFLLFHAILTARATGQASFSVGELTYALTPQGAVLYAGEEVAFVSPLILRAAGQNAVDRRLREEILGAIATSRESFSFAGDTYRVDYDAMNRTYRILRGTETRVWDDYSAPSAAHPLGTDKNGMDVLTRLMYGGRVSLVIGFVVVAIAGALGVVIGGLAGYFGGWVDQLLMRLVDIFYCIPSTPVLIILGAAMDAMRVDPDIRMLLLMLVLGLLGWPAIARLVRGQILSLREQEFMLAAEAAGLSSGRRIFHHLLPNVIPQLTVTCTMSLGSTILTEATLSFLGMGVKFPYASWGNIMNDVGNVHVLTSYWFVWIPAGICLVLAVLGFNFVGDGLRDAFDPKMKR